MATSFKFYSDIALTTELFSLPQPGLADGTDGDLDTVIYFGSNSTSKQVEATSNPGVDAIDLSLVDAAVSSGIEVANFKLASSLVGLDSAVAGAGYSLGVTLLSGVANAVAIHIRYDTPALAANDSNVSIETVDLTETSV